MQGDGPHGRSARCEVVVPAVGHPDVVGRGTDARPPKTQTAAPDCNVALPPLWHGTGCPVLLQTAKRTVPVGVLDFVGRPSTTAKIATRFPDSSLGVTRTFVSEFALATCWTAVAPDGATPWLPA